MRSGERGRPALLAALVAGCGLSCLPVAGSAAPAPDAGTSEDVTVVGKARAASGGGLIQPQAAPKSVSTVSQEYIRKQAAIQNAFQFVALTPGANVSTVDPYGLSSESSLTVRGLGQDELGYVLEGMPLNDIGFYVAYPSQFVDSENIDEISLAQGSAELDAPVISAAGGLMSVTMQDPSIKPGGSMDASYGSYHANREFIRLDTGLIGNSGLRAFASYSHTQADNWRGSGRDKRQHVDFKLVRDWGAGNRASLFGTWHDGVTTGYPLVSLDGFQQYGRSGPDNYDGTYTADDGANYWRLHVATFRLFYMGAPTTLKLGDRLSFEATPYWQYGYGNGPYGTTLTSTGNFQGAEGPYTIPLPNGASSATVMADYQDTQYRAGFTPKLTYRTAYNSLVAGYWYDYSDEHDRQPYSPLGEDGTPANIWAEPDRTLLRLPDGRLLLAGEDRVRTQVNMLFVGDTLSLLHDRLKIEAGFKEAMVRRDGTNQIPGPQYKAILNSAEPLPRLSVSYRPTPEHQVFASATTNFRTPSQATLFDSYFGGVRSGVGNTNLKPEYSISEEVGYRYRGRMITASATFFNYDFTNRQIATLVGGSNINQSINSGGQTSRGVDVELGTRPWHHVSPYVSGEYLHATIDNDLQVGADYLPTTGKTAIRSPRWQAALGLGYDDGVFFGSVGLKYVGSQYSTFMNDEKIPSHAQADVGLGYRLPELGLAARPELKLNLVNITDENYLSGVANPTANATTMTGKFGTRIDGSSPTYYLTGGFAAIVTAKQAF